MVENQQDKQLQSLRSEIDKIDEQLVSLLDQRMEVVLKVGELKKNNQEKFFIRSNREADMIKDLIKKVGPNFPKSTIVHIWRKIITAANMQEQPLRVAIHNPKNISDFDYLVKEYYSDEVPLAHFDSATSVVSELEKGEAHIGVFALPIMENEEKKEDAKENWWISLANNRLGLRVYAKIPLIEFLDSQKGFTKIQLVAVAIKDAEKSSADNSLLYIEVAKEVSKSQILSALKEQGLNGRILKSVRLHQVEGIVFYLVELEGFYADNASEIAALSKSKAKPFAKILGHYATAIKL